MMFYLLRLVQRAASRSPISFSNPRTVSQHRREGNTTDWVNSSC